MFYSLRYYVEFADACYRAEHIVSLMETIAQLLSLHYNLFFCSCFEKDKADNGTYKSFSQSAKGRTDFIRYISDVMSQDASFQKHDLFLGLAYMRDQYSISHTFEIEFFHSSPLFCPIRINYSDTDTKQKAGMDQFTGVIKCLSQFGFHTNNGFCQYFNRKNTSFALDCGHIGGITLPAEMEIMDHAAKHMEKGNKNCLADIYWGNAVKSSLLSDAVALEIPKVVGSDCFCEMEGCTVFFLDLCISSFSIPSISKKHCLRSLLKNIIA